MRALERSKEFITRPVRNLDELLRALQGAHQALALDRLLQKPERARAKAALLLVVDRDHVDRNVPGAGVVLQASRV
jgi:hypothetical protein